MANRKILENQILAGKSWHGYTSKNHILNVFGGNPVEIAQKMEQISRVDLGEDFVSMVMGYGTHYIDQDKDFLRWFIESQADETYELKQAYEDRAMTRTVGTTSGLKLGAGGSSFYLLFNEKCFDPTRVITGHKPDLYQLWVSDTVNNPVNVNGSKWLYEVKLITNQEGGFIPATEVAAGTRWSAEGGLIPDEKSRKGFDISFKSNAMLETTLSRFRMEHEISSRAKDVKPLYFFITNRETKKPVKIWLTNIEYEFYRQMRWATASMIMYGKSTVLPDKNVSITADNGFTVSAGSGFREQWSSTNKNFWSIKPSLQELNELAMGATIGKVKKSNRRMIVKAGEWGLMQLAKMVQEELGSSAYDSWRHLGDNTGRAYKWDGNEIYAKLGQFMGVATINGIEFVFMVDPSKDDPKRNKLYHPLGGLASSYEYDIMGFGDKSEKQNMQILRRKGELPQFYVEDGPLGFFKGGSKFSTPGRISTAVEGAVMHYIEPGVGGVVWDPTKIVRYYPTLTQS